MARDRDALLERVQKLLRLSTSSNVHEAAAAAARAQALIEEHRLEGLLESAEDEAVDDGRGAPLETSRRLRRWKTVLAAGLAHNNGCMAYTARVAKETRLLIIGRPRDRQAIATLWPWLVKRIEWCCATHGAGKGRSWQNAFKIGAAEVVVKRLAEANQTTRAALGTTALARVEPALKRREEAVQAFVQDNMRMKRGRRLRVDAEGYTQGRARGATMDLGGPGLTDGG